MVEEHRPRGPPELETEECGTAADVEEGSEARCAKKGNRSEGGGDYEYRVTKNTVLRRAAVDTAVAGAADCFQGPTAVALSYGDPAGIRTHPYGESPWTFGDLGQISGSGCQVHADGEIWAATLWQLRTDYMVLYGPRGRTMLEQNVVDSMKIMPASPSYLDARNGMVQAAIENGEDRCVVWQIYASRGMGEDASVAGNGSISTAIRNSRNSRNVPPAPVYCRGCTSTVPIA